MPQGASGDKRNALLICTDHWSGLLTGSAGHPVVMTPTIDQLARLGIEADPRECDDLAAEPAHSAVLRSSRSCW